MTPQNIVAVVFDFDDTLTDESTTKLLEAHGIDAEEFWSVRNQSLLDRGWDPALSYLHLILEEARQGGRLEGLANDRLGEFGRSLEFYPGIPELFTELNVIASEHQVCRPVVEFYVVSSGLEAIIKGSGIARHVQGIWGCTFEGRKDRVREECSLVHREDQVSLRDSQGLPGHPNRPILCQQECPRVDRRIPFPKYDLYRRWAY